MSTVAKLEEIAGRLQEYQEQMSAVNEALDALKKVGELISAAMAEDRTSLIGLALQMHDDAAEVVAIPAGDLQSASETDSASSIDDAVVTLEGADAPTDQENLVLEPVTAEALAAIAAVAATGSAGNEAQAVPADMPARDVQLDAIDETGKAAVMTKDVEAAVAPAAAPLVNVVDLFSRRRMPSLPLPSRRQSLGFAAGLLVLAVGGTIGQEVLQGDLLQRLIDLGSCDGEAVSANRDCALLAWMLL